jgi:nucleotide-binding universal stress UspA family protein
MTSAPDSGLVVFAYDGSDLATHAIEEAGELLSTPRDALVVTVWKPFDVGFVPAEGIQFDAEQTVEVRKAAEQTAAAGAALAERAGFRAQGCAIEYSPTWKGIIKVADEREASVIVLGSHGRSGFAGVFVGSVAGTVGSHCRRSVLIVHRQRSD